MKRLVIGLLAHVDSGKTTLAEGLLYRAGVLRKLGRVDHKDAFLDTDAQERARGITIFSKQAMLTLPALPDAEETTLTLLDTPGHVDFSAEAERAMRCWSSAAPTACRPTPKRCGSCWHVTAYLPLSSSTRWTCPERMPPCACGSCVGGSGMAVWISPPRRTPRPWPCAANHSWKKCWRTASLSTTPC